MSDLFDTPQFLRVNVDEITRLFMFKTLHWPGRLQIGQTREGCTRQNLVYSAFDSAWYSAMRVCVIRFLHSSTIVGAFD